MKIHQPVFRRAAAPRFRRRAGPGGHAAGDGIARSATSVSGCRWQAAHCRHELCRCRGKCGI